MTQVRVLTPGRSVRDRALDLIVGVLAGFTLCAGLTSVCYDARVRELKAYSTQVATSSARIVARAHQHADSTARLADSLRAAQRPVVQRAAEDTAAANVARRDADAAVARRDIRGENVALRVENRNLRSATMNLWTALHVANEINALERQRGDSLRKATVVLDHEIQGLDAQVQQLPSGPSWTAYTDVAGGGLIGYGLADENGTAVLAGVAAVALPRLARRVFRWLR